MTADFHYTYLFITVNGKADIDVKKASIDVDVSAGTQPGTPSSELAPSLKANKFDIGVNPDDIDVTLTGGLVAKIANVLIPIIKSSVIPSLINQVEQTATTLVNGQLDDDLKLYGTQELIPFLGGVTVDYAQIGGPQFTAGEVFQMGLNGTFFDASHVHKASMAPAAFALRDTSGKDAQLHLSDYTVNTAVDAGFTTGLDLDITHILGLLNVTVTTDEVAVVIPEVVTKYGAGKPVGLSGKWVTAPAAGHFHKGTADFNANLQVTMTINNEKAIFGTFNGIAGNFSIHSASGKVFGNVAAATVGTIADFTTTLGVTAEAFQKSLQDQVTQYVGELNKLLEAGVVIPSIMGVDVSDVEIDMEEGYLVLGVSLSPTSWHQIAAYLSSWKQYLLAEKKQWHLKKYVDTKMDRFGDILDEKHDELDNIVDRATEKMTDMVEKKKEYLKDKLGEVNIDIDGKHWSLSGFLDRKAQKLTDYFNKKSAKFEDAMDRKIDEFPEKKEKFLEKHVPDIKIDNHDPKKDEGVEDILDKGISRFGRMIDHFSEELSQVNDMMQ